jgi:hypothetical protein
MTMSIEDQIAAAEAALDEILRTGGIQRERLDNVGMLQYHPANIPELKAYIARLKSGRITTVKIASSKGLESDEEFCSTR